MRYAVISDIHSNIEALDAVLQTISGLGVDKIVCCGDLVGYYASPNECIETLVQRGIQCIAGNHDLAAAGIRKLDGWEVAEKAIAWTQNQLSPQNAEILKNLPSTLIIDEHFLLFHGALHPQQNPEDLYLFHEQDVIRTMEALATHPSGMRLAFFGHTHRALSYCYRDHRLTRSFAGNAVLDNDAHYLVNPGSVGQPRDGNPDASFVVFDDESRSLQFHRIPYDVAANLKKARHHKLLRDPFIKSVAKRAYRKASKLVKKAI